MANTYTQLYIQFVFAVSNREAVIEPAWEEELYKYMSGILKNNKHKPLAINGMPDHIHLFIGLNPNQSCSDLMRILKGESSEWVNLRGFCTHKFKWQSGYGAFSYSRSHIDRVCQYIINQKTHHKATSFHSEYQKLLDAHNIPYDRRYIFHDIHL